MKILSMDSSGMVAGVAITEDGLTIAEYNVNYKKTHSQTLLPMLDELAKMLELDLNTLDALAVAAGPGSFTGLRIGSATVKGLGQALNKPVIPVPTLEGMAMNMWGYPGLVCPMIDARRDQVFAGIYMFGQLEKEAAAEEFQGEKVISHGVMDLKLPEGMKTFRVVGNLQVVCDQTAGSVDEVVDKLNELGSLNPGLKVALLGDGVKAQMKRIQERISIPYDLAPANMNRQRAASVGALAEIYFRDGRFESASEHKPEYLRVSQAERERAEKRQ